MTTSTTTTTTTTTRTTPFGGLATALDGLAAAAHQARDDAPTRAVLAVVVHRLEDAAGAGLGDTDGDPLVVLQRRLGRAHGLLLERGACAVDGDLLRGLARALEPAATVAARPPVRTASAPVLAWC